MNKPRIKFLVDGYSRQALSDKEKEELLQVISNEIGPLAELIVELIEEESLLTADQEEPRNEELFNKIIAAGKPHQTPISALTEPCSTSRYKRAYWRLLFKRLVAVFRKNAG